MCVCPASAKHHMAQSQLKTVSFDELKPGSTVRVLMEDSPLIHVIDLAVVVTGKGANQAAEAVRRIKPEVFDPVNKILLRPNPVGGHSVKFVTYKDALELILVIGGKQARFFRKRVANILLGHFEHNVHRFIDWTVETAKQAQEETTELEPETKYIYGAKSEAFPGLVKIGYASSLDARMVQANVFSAPAPFKIVAQTPSMDAPRDERMTHAFFADQREEGEFFRVSVEALENFFANCILPMYNHEKSVL